MTCERVIHVLVVLAILQAGATPYFFVFWRWFSHWRAHWFQTGALMIGTFSLLGVLLHELWGVVLAARLDLPAWLSSAGWALLAVAYVFGLVADRQIGFRVRSFTPFFESHGRIRLKTTGAYGVVRHPIYTSGIGYQLGVFLVSGYVAVLIACVTFVLGALYFTRQEERRLMELLEDPSEYERYRSRVPALFPRLRRKA
jgi:protein-S-isoprenylcysteine O-methyltransferase Ste14